MSDSKTPETLNTTNFAAPPFVPPLTLTADGLEGLDLRGYELMQPPLGVGGMGEVYRAVDPALGRELAVKVMKSSYRGSADSERRFIREARVTGSLQHPGIVPVYNLGRLADGRLHYTMRLVRGRTLADILKEEGGKAEHWPDLLTIFVKICDAVAYAHSKRVIHRDLKPSNVMVGRFGEVQVMDWGLAKLLIAGEPDSTSAASATDTAGTIVRVESEDGSSDLTHAGRQMGTLAYMPPEQALGEWDMVDERADVFALGAILCEILTGAPPYRGRDSEEIYRRVRRGDVSEALARLETCGAEAALVELCRICLAAERDRRPRDAGVVAVRISVYQAEVGERLRQAELERVAAQTRAQEQKARADLERRAKRRTVALAAAVLLLVIGGAVGSWWLFHERTEAQARQKQIDGETRLALDRARQELDEGWQTQDLAQLKEAEVEVERAVDIAHSGAGDEARQQAETLRTVAQQRLSRAEKNRELLNALLDVATPHETKTYRAARSGELTALAEPSGEEQYAAAFRRRWPDLDLEKDPTAAAARMREEPEVVVQGVIAGLDSWMRERYRQPKRSDESWRCLLRLVEQLDHSPARRQLRGLLLGTAEPRAEDVAALWAGPPPWAGLWQIGRGNDWRRLRHLREQMNVEAEPVLTVLLLAQASRGVGDTAGAEAVLRQALAHWPDQVPLLDALAKLLQQRGRWAEAIGCYRAARARRAGLGMALSSALVKAGQAPEAAAILRDLIRRQPANPEWHSQLGYILDEQGKFAEAEAACRKAIELQPDSALAYNNLGFALSSQKKFAAGEAACRKSIELKPDNALAYVNLSFALVEQAKYAEAEAICRKAVALQADASLAYTNLGFALNAQKRYAEGEAACRKSLALKPDNALAYLNLGYSLSEQRKYAAAEAVYRKAIAVKPDFAKAHYRLGYVLNEQLKYAAAEAACRRSVALDPNNALAYFSLGYALTAQRKYAAGEAAYRKAVALNPDNAAMQANLGYTLNEQGKYAEAEAAYRKAIALRPKDASAHHNLAFALAGQGKTAAAETAYRKAIALKPDNALAYCNLGHVLSRQGRFTEALTAFRRGHELGSKQPGWNSPSAKWIENAERQAKVEQKLWRVLAAEDEPQSVEEALELARMCQQSKQRYAAAARLYAAAFAAEPSRSPRYDAACNAALAAAGKGKDAHLLPDKVAVMFRHWALGWLRADLTALRQQKAIPRELVQWQRDADLASVRDPRALARLPAHERAAWQALWRDVEELAKRLTK